jgi:hypothetical protein
MESKQTKLSRIFLTMFYIYVIDINCIFRNIKIKCFLMNEIF